MGLCGDKMSKSGVDTGFFGSTMVRFSITVSVTVTVGEHGHVNR